MSEQKRRQRQDSTFWGILSMMSVLVVLMLADYSSTSWQQEIFLGLFLVIALYSVYNLGRLKEKWIE